MGQEDDRDEAPDPVQAGVFTQRWYLLQVPRDRADMGLYVRLVAPQVEPVTRLERELLCCTSCQGVQDVPEARCAGRIGGVQVAAPANEFR